MASSLVSIGWRKAGSSTSCVFPLSSPPLQFPLFGVVLLPLIIHLQYFYGTLKDNLLFQYGTVPLPPPLKSMQTLHLKHGKPFDVMDLLWVMIRPGWPLLDITSSAIILFWYGHSFYFILFYFILLPIGHQSICSSVSMWFSPPAIVSPLFCFYCWSFCFFCFFCTIATIALVPCCLSYTV